MKPSPGNLPALLSSFIGRKRELAEVRELLRTARLVTLTGAGGCGKTRLALQVAGDVRAAYEDGVWLTELASLADPALVPQAIASTLSVREEPGKDLMQVLVDHLRPRTSLLVLDNCEHLIGACAGLAAALLQACPGLSILATSRESLGIPGEIVWNVPPLSLPEPQPWRSPKSQQHALVAYRQSESVQLFVARAAAVSGGFALTAESGPWVAEICRRLDGMPLAIELAAARLRALAVQQVAELLGDRFKLLTGGNRTAPPRHQTLEATLDWSYALLSAKEQKVLQRLSVFAGGATLQAAEAVCAGSDVSSADVLGTLSRLVDKSLVIADAGGEQVRYRLLETIREYALARLSESEGAAETKDRHLDFFVRWAEETETYLVGPEVRLGMQRFDPEHDNLRAALEWSQRSPGKAEAGLRLAAATWSFWRIRGFHNEGRTRLSRLLAHPEAQAPTVARANALHRAALHAFYQSDYPACKALSEQSLEIFQAQGPAGKLGVADALELLAEVASETGNYSKASGLYEKALPLYEDLGNWAGMGDTLKMRGWLDMRAGDYERAEAYLEQGLAACRKSGDLRHIASALSGLGELAVRTGRYERAKEILNESLTLSRGTGEKWGLAIVLGSLGWVALLQRDFKSMAALIGESLSIRLETGDRGGIAWCLEKMAQAACLQSHFQRAAVLSGGAAALRAPVGSVIDAVDKPEYDRMLAEVRRELGEQAFSALSGEGAAMSTETILDYALHEPEPTTAESSRAEKEKYGGLTAREREVAGWIAQGKSNREIAEAMTVGLKTVETYVTRILDKLGFESRVQIALWAKEQGLAPPAKS